MKSKKEIEALALELYPKMTDYMQNFINAAREEAFIKGYEMAQDETHLPPKLMAGQEFFEAIERTCDFTPLLDDMQELINALILDNYRVKPPTK